MGQQAKDAWNRFGTSNRSTTHRAPRGRRIRDVALRLPGPHTDIVANAAAVDPLSER